MVGVSEQYLLQAKLVTEDLERLRTLDIFNILSLDPVTHSPYSGCPMSLTPKPSQRKFLDDRMEHLQRRCHNDSIYRVAGAPDYKTLSLLRRFLLPQGGKGFNINVWNDICSRSRDGHKRTWVCCGAALDDSQVLASRKKPLTGHGGHDHGLGGHVQYSHRDRCPCGTTKESGYRHLVVRHFFAFCQPDCGRLLVEDWTSHLASSHPYSKCRVQRCGELFFIGISRHLALDHGLRKCSDCCLACLEDTCGISNHDKESAWQHVLQHHSWAECPRCGLFVQRDTLPAHLGSHGWVSCKVCGHMEPDAEALDTHMQNHPLCRVCKHRIMEALMDQHLKIHNSGICPIPTCAEMVPLASFPSHFAKLHNNTEACPESGCEELQSKSGLLRHLINVHDWILCTICSEPVCRPLAQHEYEKHGVRPCPDCPSRFAEADMELHRTTKHGLRKCPFCGELVHTSTVMQHLLGCPERLRASGPSAESNIPPSGAGAGATPNVRTPGPDPKELAATLRQALQQGTASEEAMTQQLEQLCDAVGLTLLPRSPISSVLPPPSRKRRASSTQGSNKRAAPKSVASLVTKLTESAFSNFVELVKGVRGLGSQSGRHQLRELRQLTGDPVHRVPALYEIINGADAGIHVQRLIRHRGLALLANTLTATREEKGRDRMDSADFDAILDSPSFAALMRKQRKPREDSRRWLINSFKEGMQVLRVTRPYEGLICFISHTNARPYLRLSDNDLEQFHTDIAQFQHFWEAGGHLLEIINGKSMNFMFECQSSTTEPQSKESLVQLLQVVEQRVRTDA
ncbi:hypothetical protein B0H63DRAFT_467464 [Podospora didyma]|uniref:C2H2-type domain-containing protein n=1 Tax=Podospora didyma TaxID=330526 RepID=A0AAE0U511_9PEZI|nr:hypothetical protein B0H63DRAFT_467464 [Podospora didyma]